MTKARELSDYTGLQADLALKSPIASPSFTGNVGVGAGTALSPLDVKSGFITVSKDAATAGRIGASAYITGSTANDLIVQATGSGVTKLYQSGVNSLNIDSSGIVTKPLQPAFRVCKDTGDTSSTGYMVWNVSKINVGGHYSTSTGKFTAPVAGNYYFAVRALTLSATQNNIWIGINHNGNAVLQTYHSHINHSNISGEAVITMAANDYVQTYWGGTGGIHTGGTNHHVYSFFQGHLIG